MPFINHSTTQFHYDLSNYKPVTVMANHSKNSKLIPIFIRYELSDESIENIKIEKIKYIRDYPGYMLFSCYINHYGKYREIILIFQINMCKWYLINY